MKLSEKQMEKICKDGTISNCNKDEVKQIMNYMFGEEFMESKNKGEVKNYEV